MKNSLKKIISGVALISLACFTFSFIGVNTASAAANPATVNLGGAASFGVLSKTAISDTVLVLLGILESVRPPLP